MRLTLPLQDHALELVVQHHDLDTDVVLRGGLQLHGGHAERRVAVDVYDNLVRCAHFCADG